VENVTLLTSKSWNSRHWRIDL